MVRNANDCHAPTAAVFIEVVKGRSLREFELAADATAYT
jgi:hypothetical protein